MRYRKYSLLKLIAAVEAKQNFAFTLLDCMYSMGHKKVPVPFTWNGISTVLCVAFPYRFRVYNFRTSNFDAFDVRTYWKV